MTKMSVIKLL